MLILSSVHIHEDQEFSETECSECIAHHCHGHVTQAVPSFDACVLCQFLSLSFVIASVAVAIVVFNVLRKWTARMICAAYGANRGVIVTRGPPAL